MEQRPATVALTGGTGFVGRHVLAHLLEAGYHVRMLARHDPGTLANPAQVQVIRGDLFDHQAVAQLVAGARFVIHLVGIIQEQPARGQTFQRVHVLGTRNIVEAARAAGVQRFVHMSALGARPGAASEYHKSKWFAEEILRRSVGENREAAHGRNLVMSFTIFRPSIIHGPDGEFMAMVKQFCTRRLPPFMPYFGGGFLGGQGGGRLQPVYVEDVAACFVAALTSELAMNQVYPMGGPDIYSWPLLYQICHQHLPGARPGKKPRAIPVWLANLITRFPGAPFNRDQVIMSQEDSVCTTALLEEHFGLTLAPFEATFAQYAASIP